MLIDVGKEKILNFLGYIFILKVDWSKIDFEKEIILRIDLYVEIYLKFDVVMEKYDDIKKVVNLFYDKMDGIILEMESEWI